MKDINLSRCVCSYKSIVAILCAVLVSESAEVLGIQFEEVTGSAGIDYIGPSFGASWGDVNSDGWPDIWVSNHANTPSLYINNADGTFSDEIFRAENRFSSSDMHGAAWADFDNDGDQDLLTLAGAQSGLGVGANQFFINASGTLQEQGADYGLDYPLGRGRVPLWFDWDQDGKLDVFLANESRADGQAPTALFTQTENGFIDSVSQTGLTTTSSIFAQLLTVGTYSGASLIINNITYPEGFYDYRVLPFQDLSSLFALTPLSRWMVRDAAIADFNGDLLSDIFLVRHSNGSEVIQENSNRLSAQIFVNGTEKGFTFRADGVVQFEIGPFLIRTSDIYIGGDGYSPEGAIFSVSSDDPATVGILPHVPGVKRAVYIGYDLESGLWHVLVNSPSWLGAGIVVSADSTIYEYTPIGFESWNGAESDQLFVQSGTGFADYSMVAGFGDLTLCQSVVAADFDNDMDVDLYLLCRGTTTNNSNILYENLGNGTFRSVTGAGGAAGSTAGRGEGVAAADYDRDGFVDLFITNGFSGKPFNNGPSQLFRNTGGSNHWLEIDLEGVVSNRDGVGSRVTVTSGDLTQVRDQDGGMHRFSQDFQRIHFGLADETVVDRVEVLWPSGQRQVLTDVAADQILRITEAAVQPPPNADEAPTITAIVDQLINESASTDALLFVVGDVETAPDALTVIAVSSDPKLIPDSNLILGGGGANRTIIVTPVENESGGPVKIRLTVSDGAASDSTSFDVTVASVNDPPVAQDDEASVTEGSTISINVAENDADADDGVDLAGITIVSEPVNGEITVRTDGVIDYSETVDGAKSDSFTYTIKDVSGSVSNVATVTIDVLLPQDAAAPVVTSADNGGGGCMLSSASAADDPVIPLMVLLSMIYLFRRRL